MSVMQSAVGNPYLFNGRRYDPETGYYYYRTRYLDPHTGRFISRDTIGLWGDANNLGNGYSYVGNNPWTLVDPYGKGPIEWLTGRSDPTSEELEAALDAFLDFGSDDGHLALEGIAYIPVAGIPADLANARWYYVEGEYGEAGWALIGVVPIAGEVVGGGRRFLKTCELGKDLKLLEKLKQADKLEGIYVFIAKSGKKYVGQSKDILRRLSEHLGEKLGKTVKDLKTIEFWPVEGGIDARRLAEQFKVNELNGIRYLENERNPVAACKIQELAEKVAKQKSDN